MNRTPRFFHDGELRVGTCITVTGSAHHHLAHVLRLRNGAAICLFNGDGVNYRGQIQKIDRHQTLAELVAASPGPAPSGLHTVLAIGVSKPRLFDLALQKATELGVSEIVPLAAARSPGHEVRGNRKQRAHWQGVIVSACEQCGRAELPVLAGLTDIGNLAREAAYESHLRLLLEPDGEPLSGAVQAREGGVVLSCGPEGGFTDAEKEALVTEKFLPVSCGPRILRTETAPLAMLAIVQYLWGDLRGHAETMET